MTTLYRVGGIGFDLAATIVVFGVVGYGTDRLLNIDPWGIVVGLILGLVVGFIRLIRTAARLSRES
jgi:F0F1-type ATP synthase assembly protein I